MHKEGKMERRIYKTGKGCILEINRKGKQRGKGRHPDKFQEGLRVGLQVVQGTEKGLAAPFWALFSLKQPEIPFDLQTGTR